MWKKFLPVLSVLLLTGCAGMFTRLTPLQQSRNASNLYPVEVAFNSQQQSLRWETIQPYVLVNGELYPMHQVQKVQIVGKASCRCRRESTLWTIVQVRLQIQRRWLGAQVHQHGFADL